MPFIFASNSSHRWIEICKVKIANYSSCKAAYANTLPNVDFRRSLLQQCASVELTLKCLVSVYPPPVLLSGHWQERKSSQCLTPALLLNYCCMGYLPPSVVLISDCRPGLMHDGGRKRIRYDVKHRHWLGRLPVKVFTSGDTLLPFTFHDNAVVREIVTSSEI